MEGKTMNRRDFLSAMLAAGAAPFVVTADGQLILTDDGPLVGTLYGFGAPNVAVVQDIVQLGDLPGDGPTPVFPSSSLGHQDPTVPGGMKWTNQPMGDYLDASGTLNGTNHYASTTFPNIGPWDVTALVQKLLVDGNTGFHMMSTTSGAPQIAGKTSATPPVLSITTTT